MTTIIESIKRAENILIVCHIRPDGDCLGAGFALKHIAENAGKSADIMVDSPPPEAYSFIPNFSALNDQKLSSYDLSIAVDCADDQRLGRYLPVFNKSRNSINIDHHRTNNRFAKVNIVDPDRSSTCELLYEHIKDENVIDPLVATMLYLGISTDTGNFMHDNTKPRTLEAAAKLFALGADHRTIIDEFYKNNSKNKLFLTARAIESMRFFDNDTIVVISVTRAMLAECGCVLADTEGLIDYGTGVGSVKVAICMSEQSDRSYKVSYRSKSADVSAAAATFGGGGHKLAAGCVVNGYYEDVVQKVVSAARRELEI